MAANSPSLLTVPTKIPQLSPLFAILSLPSVKFPVPSLFKCHCGAQSRFFFRRTSHSVRCCSLPEDGEPLGAVDDLRVPDHWLIPSKASEEAEWLRVTLHKWLDDEYCPEPTNVEISKLAAESYYISLMQKTTDLGEILLKMGLYECLPQIWENMEDGLLQGKLGHITIVMKESFVQESIFLSALDSFLPLNDTQSLYLLLLTDCVWPLI